ncbi:hypothetical protein CsSME_00016201 [Camellia sinensis var. sinensis]
MMTTDEKTKITKAYEQDGDGAVMWAGKSSGVIVYFTDVKDLVRGDSLCGNDMLRNSNMKSVEKYVLKKISASKEC